MITNSKQRNKGKKRPKHFFNARTFPWDHKNFQKVPLALARTKKLFASESGLMVEGLALSGSGFWELLCDSCSMKCKVAGTLLYWFQGFKTRKLGQRFKIEEKLLKQSSSEVFSCCRVENNSNSFDDISFASTNKVYGFPIVVAEEQQGIPSKHVNFHVKIDKSCFHFVVRWKCSSTPSLCVFISRSILHRTSGQVRRHMWTSDYEL